jgi:hypothetical protein
VFISDYQQRDRTRRRPPLHLLSAKEGPALFATSGARDGIEFRIQNNEAAGATSSSGFNFPVASSVYIGETRDEIGKNRITAHARTHSAVNGVRSLLERVLGCVSVAPEVAFSGEKFNKLRISAAGRKHPKPITANMRLSELKVKGHRENFFTILADLIFIWRHNL